MEHYIGRHFMSVTNMMFKVCHKDTKSGWYTIQWLNNLFIHYSDISAMQLYGMICNGAEVCPLPID